MKVYRDLDQLKNLDREKYSAVAVGTFDGCHIGHTKVLDSMIKYAADHGQRSFVYTFSNNPMHFLNPDKAPRVIMSPEEKLYILEQMGVDCCLMLPFDEEQMKYSAEAFISRILIKETGMKSLFVGHDFKFGTPPERIDSLIKYAAEYDFKYQVLDPVMQRGLRISSTDIRKYLMEGDLDSAGRMLGREHFTMGKVIHGKKRGRTMNIPTVNIQPTESVKCLKKGVYFTRTAAAGEIYNSLTNIGSNPTFEGGTEFFAETFILDFDQDIYGEDVKTEFLKWHRDEIKFEGRLQLIDQINDDVRQAAGFFRQDNR